MDCVKPLPGQYYFTKSHISSIPDGFERETIRDWNVVFDSDFSTYRVHRDDAKIGFVIGEALNVESADGEEIRIRNPGSRSQTPIGRRFQQYLRGFVGRYVGAVNTGDGIRVYTDPVGALPVVYSTDHEVVAASPLSLPQVTQSTHFRPALFEAVSSTHGSWLPGTITYYDGVKHLLPNHYFDLGEWEAKRYYLSEPPERRPTQSIVDDILARLREVFSTIVTRYDEPTMALTAGRDSRSLLGAARRWVNSGELSLYTFDGRGYELDRTIAQKIAQSRDLNLDVISIQKADSHDERTWLEKTGYGVTSETKDVHPTMRSFESDAQIQGIGGEIARGYYWGDSDDRQTEIDSTELLRRFHRPHHPELVKEVENWLTEVQRFDTYTTLDLAYQEHRLGRWGGPQHLGKPAHLDHLLPFSFQPIVDLMYQLPESVRRNDELAERMIECAWPELNEYPYNEFVGWRKYWEGRKLVRMGLTEPKKTIELVLNKIR